MKVNFPAFHEACVYINFNMTKMIAMCVIYIEFHDHCVNKVIINESVLSLYRTLRQVLEEW